MIHIIFVTFITSLWTFALILIIKDYNHSINNIKKRLKQLEDKSGG